MRALHLFFQLHQPYTLKAPEGGEHEYFGGGADFREANQKYYQPFFALLERNTQRYPGLKVSLLVSGTWLDQAELYEPDLVRRLQKLVDLKQVELVAAPYYHSLSAFYDKDEFFEQVVLSRQKFEGKFSTTLTVLATPGLMYHDRLAKWAGKAGFRGALAGDGTEILGFRSAGRVYDAAGCEDFRVLFENGRLSRALVRGEDLVLATSVKVAEDFSEEAKEGEADVASEVRGARKRATAAEFVRGRAGVSSARSTAANSSRERAMTIERRVYSAKKLQKELEMVCLRGNLVSLSLDARMFGEHREEGVVACFDEFFANWLKVPGNKFVTASEALTEFEPTAEISVKATVMTSTGVRGAEDVRDNEAKAGRAALARVEEVQYTLPEGMRSGLMDQLYELRPRVLKTKNEDLKRDFQKLTAMDYAFQPEFEKVVEDFGARVAELLPKPKQLRAENDGRGDEAGEASLTAKRADAGGVTGDEDLATPEDDYTVKVHRILKKSAAERSSRSSRPEDYELEGGAEFLGAEDLEEDVEGLADFETEDLAEFKTESSTGEEDESEEADGVEDEIEEMMDAFDAAEAEVQVIAQRMKRSKKTPERELEALMEAEVVAVRSEGPSADNQEAVSTKRPVKKKARRRIVLD